MAARYILRITVFTRHASANVEHRSDTSVSEGNFGFWDELKIFLLLFLLDLIETTMRKSQKWRLLQKVLN